MSRNLLVKTGLVASHRGDSRFNVSYELLSRALMTAPNSTAYTAR